MRKLLNTLFIAVFWSTALSAQVVINEFSNSNAGYNGGSGANNYDWIELYNSSSTPSSLDGYYLSDNLNNPTKWQIPNGTSIPANGFLVIFASGNNITTGVLHTNFKINQTEQEQVLLSNPSGSIIDSYSITFRTQTNHSRGRQTNGSSTWVVFENATPNASNNTQTGFTGYCNLPSFSLNPGFYSGQQILSLSSNQPNTEIRFTTNGTEPVSTSQIYSTPITINNTTVIRARVFSTDNSNLPSRIETNSYFINTNHTIAVISATGDIQGFLSQWANGPGIQSSFEYFDDQGVFRAETYGDMRPHGNDSWNYNTQNKGMRFHTQDEYGYGDQINASLYKTSQRDKFSVVILKSGASDNYPYATTNAGWISCHIRDVFCHTLAQKHDLNLDYRRYEPCALYLNGQYWGLYEMRERVDEDYCKYYYDVDEENLDMLRFWGGMIYDSGTNTDWCALNDYMNVNNLSNDAAYAYVASRLDILSFIDYFIINTFVMNNDWLNWNTHWWQATGNPAVKWRYSLWDQDNILGCGGPAYTGLQGSTNENPCEVENLFQNGGCDIAHVNMFNRLMQNPQFFEQYINRYSQLNNTLLNCNIAIAHLDSLVGRIEGEMQSHINRWGGNMNQWQNNLQRMRDTLSARCTIINNQIVDCYEPQISGPYNITVLEYDTVPGKIIFNNIPLTDTTWTGTYFGGISATATAQSNDPCYVFDKWVTNNGTITPSLTSSTITYTMNSNDTLIALFKKLFINARDTFACKGNSINIDLGNISGQIQWYNLASNQLENIGTTFSINLNENKNYEIRNGGCRDTINIEAIPLPEFVFNKDTFLKCEGESDTITAILEDATWLWSNGETTSSIVITQPGIYTATATKDNCSYSKTATAEFELKPEIIKSSDTTICKGGKATLTVNGNFEKIKWFDNDTTNTKEINFADYILFEAFKGICSVSDSVKIAEEECYPCTIHIPNAVTPNNDQLNDLFEIVHSNCNFLNYNLYIYNRFGRLVYYSENPNDSWNPENEIFGMFVYNLFYTSKDKATGVVDNIQTKGTIVLTK